MGTVRIFFGKVICKLTLGECTVISLCGKQNSKMIPKIFSLPAVFTLYNIHFKCRQRPVNMMV